MVSGCLPFRPMAAPSDVATDRRVRRTRRSVVRRYVPPQHGAWAMLLVPFTAGVLLAGPDVVHVPLLVAWIGGYLLSYYALLALKTRRPSRVLPQLRLYGAVTVPALVVVVLLRPQLLWFAPAFAGLAAVTAWYAWRRDDRSAVAGIASVAQGALMVLVAAVAGRADPAATWPAAVVVLLYFAGTVLFVKTMIRERGEPAWWRASVLYHAAATVVAAVLSWPLGLLFGWFLLRAARLPRRALRPRVVGMMELANSLVLLVAVVRLV